MKTRILIISLSMYLLISCEAKHAAAYESNDESTEIESVNGKITTDSISAESSEMVSSAATYQDEKRKFVRKADANFETKDVYKTTLAIEQNVTKMKGFVVNSNIQKQIIKTDEFKQSSDSIQLIRTIQSNNLLTVKIPQRKLGEFLISLEPYVLFLNSRGISADDVSLDFDFQTLDKKRIDNTNQKLTTTLSQNGKIGEKGEIIDKIDEKVSEKNYGIIQAKQLNENVQMSEVTLQINEFPKVVSSIVPDTSGIYAKYHSNFWHRTSRSFSSGM